MFYTLALCMEQWVEEESNNSELRKLKKKNLFKGKISSHAEINISEKNSKAGTSI